MVDEERIKKEADAFFEWPTPDKSGVSTESMIIFCTVIAEMVRKEEREACARAVFLTRLESEADDAPDHGVSNWLNDAEDAIRERSNVELSGAKRPLK